MLVGLWELLEVAHAKAFIGMCQWILENNRAAMAEAEQDRTQTLSVQQDRVERDLRQQLAQTQNMVVDLQHEVHFLNNQLHPILNEEEEDLEMLIEDDGWEEEEVELEGEDDPISDLNSEHVEDQHRLVTSKSARCILVIYVMDLQLEVWYS